MKFINVKSLRKYLNFLLDIIYKTPLKTPFLFLISRLPLQYLYKSLWINSSDYYLDSFENDFRIKMKKAKVSFKNKDILEIGSGSSFGWGYLFTILGAKTFTASDLSRSANMSKKAYATELDLIRKIEAKYSKKIIDKLVATKKGQIKSINPRLKSIQLDITQPKLLIKKKYNLIISNAVMEHLPKNKVNQAIKNMNSLLKPGGYMIHQIDLRDHFNFNHPFSFYQYSDKQWNRITNHGSFYTNRLRTSDYINLFSKNKFYVHYQGRTISKSNTIRKTHPSFHKYSKQDLSVEDLTISLKKK